MKNIRPNSLRRRLLARLAGPLLGLMFIGALLSFASARYFAGMVHDQWLFDSVMSLATQVKGIGGKATVNLPIAAVQILEWDQTDRIFYDVSTVKLGHIYGNAVISEPIEIAVDRPSYYDSVIEGLPVRVAAVALAVPSDGNDAVTVKVAETLAKRDAVVRSIIMAMLPLEGTLLALAGLIIWFAVSSALAKFDMLSQRLEKIDIDRLAPLDQEIAAPSEVQPLVDALNSLIGRLGAAHDAQRRFVANAAHQLRTPLATVQLQTERALREADPAQHAEALSAVRNAMIRLKHLTQQLLTLARAEPESARMLELVDVDLAVLTRDELGNWMDAAIQHDIDLGYEGPVDGIHILGEPQLLREMIANLVDNAIRYGKQGGRITVRIDTDPVRLSVEDDGPGIPAAERTRITERFYRLPSSASSGTGLGLAIVTEIASRHNAKLEISAPADGNGTLARVSFGLCG